MTTKDALKRTRELLRAIADMTGDISDFTAIESRVTVLDILINTDSTTEDDEVLAVYGTIADLDSALDRLPDATRRQLEKDNASVLHDVGRWHSAIFRQPSFKLGERDGRHVVDILDDIAARGLAMSTSIDHLLSQEPGMDPSLQEALAHWVGELSSATSEIRSRQDYARDDPEIFWAGQMVAEACVRLARIAWSAVAVFAYSATSKDPNRVPEAREALVESARAAGRSISASLGSWPD